MKVKELRAGDCFFYKSDLKLTPRMFMILATDIEPADDQIYNNQTHRGWYQLGNLSNPRRIIKNWGLIESDVSAAWIVVRNGVIIAK